jgi:hypothetical protein
MVLVGACLAGAEKRFLRFLPVVFADILTLLDYELVAFVWTSGTEPWK